VSDLNLTWREETGGDSCGRGKEEYDRRTVLYRAEEMTAECNGHLGQLPTLSGLQVADPGMADG